MPDSDGASPLMKKDQRRVDKNRKQNDKCHEDPDLDRTRRRSKVWIYILLTYLLIIYPVSVCTREGEVHSGQEGRVIGVTDRAPKQPVILHSIFYCTKLLGSVGLDVKKYKLNSCFQKSHIVHRR